MKNIRTLLLLLALLLVPTACVAEDAAEGDYEVVRVGDMLPSFEAETLDGQTVTTASMAGRTAVIVLFSTACADCRKELPDVQAVADETAEAAAFLCIGREETAEAASAFWQEQGLTMACSPQPDRKLYERFARRGVPRVYVAAASGRVTAVFSERVSKRRLRTAIAEAAAQP